MIYKLYEASTTFSDFKRAILARVMLKNPSRDPSSVHVTKITKYSMIKNNQSKPTIQHHLDTVLECGIGVGTIKMQEWIINIGLSEHGNFLHFPWF